MSTHEKKPCLTFPRLYAKNVHCIEREKTPIANVAKTKTDGIGQTKNMRSEVLSLPAAFTFSRLRHKKRPLKRRTGKRNAPIKTEDTAYAYRICVCAFMAKNVHCIEQKNACCNRRKTRTGGRTQTKVCVASPVFAAFAFARLCRIRPPTRRTRQNSAQKKAESFCLLPHLRHEKRMTYAFFSYILSGACMPRRDKPFLSTVRAAFTARRRAFCSERLSLITRRSI